MKNDYHLIKPVVSNSLLDKYWQDFIIGSSESNITINTYRGSWTTSILMYLCRTNLAALLESRLLVIPLNINNLLISKDNFFDYPLSYINTFYVETATPVSDIFQFIQDKTFKQDYQVVFLLNGFGAVFGQFEKSNLLVTLIKELKNINPISVKFIFINTTEIDTTDLDIIGPIAEDFLASSLWQLNYDLDIESVANILCNETKRDVFSPDSAIVKQIHTLCIGDPSMVQVIGRLIKTIDFNYDNLIANISEDSIYLRYKQIVVGLKPSSIQALVNSETTEYLIKTGLVRNNKPMNKLFSGFLVQNKDKLVSTVAKTDIRCKLTGQELLLFDLLLHKSFDYVSKDEVAHTIWGESWQDVYSDWAIDKLVSTLRKKLSDNNYSKTIKAVRNKGIMLV